MSCLIGFKDNEKESGKWQVILPLTPPQHEGRIESDSFPNPTPA